MEASKIQKGPQIIWKVLFKQVEEAVAHKDTVDPWSNSQITKSQISINYNSYLDKAYNLLSNHKPDIRKTICLLLDHLY